MNSIQIYFTKRLSSHVKPCFGHLFIDLFLKMNVMIHFLYICSSLVPHMWEYLILSFMFSLEWSPCTQKICLFRPMIKTLIFTIVLKASLLSQGTVLRETSLQQQQHKFCFFFLCAHVFMLRSATCRCVPYLFSPPGRVCTYFCGRHTRLSDISAESNHLMRL